MIDERITAMDNMNNNAAKDEQIKGDKGGYKGNRRFNNKNNKKRFDKEQPADGQKTQNKNFEKKQSDGKNYHNKKNGDFHYKGKNNYKKFDNKKKNKEYKRSENEVDLVKAEKMGIIYEGEIEEKLANPQTKEDGAREQHVSRENFAKEQNTQKEQYVPRERFAKEQNTQKEQHVSRERFAKEQNAQKEQYVPREKFAKDNAVKESESKEENAPREDFSKDNAIRERGPKEQNTGREEFVAKNKDAAENGKNDSLIKKEHKDVLVNDFNIEKDYGTNKQSDKIKREDVASDKKMIEIIGVRFRKAGKIYYFSRGKYDIEVNQNVIVETARGVEYGRVVLAPRMVEDKPAYHPMKTIIRVATPNDDKIESDNKKKEKEALAICLEKIKKHNLEMKLIDCEYTFDNNKVLFYFTADGRIDFRELVKDLAAVFRTRIELRQIGVRDETKIVGGIGTCGRPLCCHTYLSDFIPVSIKMAKEQNLSLNPTKISGVCGRLMCCLKNEEDWYEEANMKLPYIGDHVDTVDGFKGEVHSVNVVKQLVRVIITLENDEKEAREYHVDDLKFERRKRHEKVAIDDELRKLEMLEKHDIKSNLEDE